MTEDSAASDPAVAGRAFLDVDEGTPERPDLRSAAQARLAEGFTRPGQASPIIVAIPLYRNAHLVSGLVSSLLDCAEELRELQAEVVLFNDSPDDADLAQAVAEALPFAQAAFSCRLEQNEENLGFVRTANRALAEGAKRACDVLLLNSDTIVHPGAFREMVRVSRLDPMTGFVNPRSNNATLATLPPQAQFRAVPPAEAFADWARLAPRLPPVTYVPTAVGFCLLIRWTILAEFGLFDEIYGAGYNEENDLILRAGRRGYRAVLANHAFVWHQRSGSFGAHQTSELELRNALVFNARYPEYGRLVGIYFTSAEYRAEELIGNLIPDAEGRLDLAFDFSNVAPAYNGTFLAARWLLAGAAEAWRGEFNLYVLCSEEAYEFHRYAELSVARLDPAGAETFAVMFRVGQPYDLGALERLVERSAVFGVFMLDTISIDSAPLVEPGLFELWQLTLEHADVFAATTDLTADQYQRRFSVGEGVTRLRSLHSLDLADYAAPDDAPPPAAPGYIFVVGNHYWHKDVAVAAEALALADPDRTVVVVAGAHDEAGPPTDPGRYAPRTMATPPNLIRLPAGQLTNAQIGSAYANASAVVFPSHYEGFGFPLLNALAAHRPVFIRPLPVFAEINRALGGEGNLHIFQTVEALVEALRTPPAWDPQTASPGRPGDSARATQDVRDALTAALSKVGHARIARRIRALRTIRLFAPQPPPPVEAAPPPAPAPSLSGSDEAVAAIVLDDPDSGSEVTEHEAQADLPSGAASPIDGVLIQEADLHEAAVPGEPVALPPAPRSSKAEQDGYEADPVRAAEATPDLSAEMPVEIEPASAPDPSAAIVHLPAAFPVITAPATPRAFLAHRASLAAERCAYGILGLPGVLPALRIVGRTIRAIGGG